MLEISFLKCSLIYPKCSIFKNAYKSNESFFTDADSEIYIAFGCLCDLVIHPSLTPMYITFTLSPWFRPRHFLLWLLLYINYFHISSFSLTIRITVFFCYECYQHNGVSRLSILGKFNKNLRSWSHTMFLRLDVVSVRVLMFIFQHFFQWQEFWSWTQGVAKPLSCYFLS